MLHPQTATSKGPPLPFISLTSVPDLGDLCLSHNGICPSLRAPPNDSHFNHNFPLPPSSDHVCVPAGFLFKSSCSKRGDEDLRSAWREIRYYIDSSKVGTRGTATGDCNRAKGQRLTATSLVKRIRS